jgi:hypothetical protein
VEIGRRATLAYPYCYLSDPLSFCRYATPLSILDTVAHMHLLRSVLPYVLIFGSAVVFARFVQLPDFRLLSFEQIAATAVAACYAVMGLFGLFMTLSPQAEKFADLPMQGRRSCFASSLGMIAIASLLLYFVYAPQQGKRWGSIDILIVVFMLMLYYIMNYYAIYLFSAAMRESLSRVNAWSIAILSPVMITWAAFAQIGVVEFSPLLFLTGVLAFAYLASTVAGFYDLRRSGATPDSQ